MNNIKENIDVIKNTLLATLRSASDGISEYDLIQRIKADIFPGECNEALFKDTARLFAVHFIVYHGLYHLREDLWTSRAGNLEISALNIRICPYTGPAGNGLGKPDRLASYYLDLSNLTDTSQEDIDKLLGYFWQHFIHSDEKMNALSILELDEPFDKNTLTNHYRRMAMKFHPDRGGDNIRIQEINSAFQVLKRCL